MATKPASVDRLGGLHAKVTELFEKFLDDALNPTENSLPPTAADLGVITKFLKDNDITADPGVKDELDELRQRLSQAQASRRKSIIEAASEVNKDLH